MSADNEVRIRRKQNGLYIVVDAMVEADDGILIADDVDGLDKAVEKANAYMEDNEVEYGLSIN